MREILLSDYTVEETAKAYICDESVQFALDIQRDGQYVCPRAMDNYRKLFREEPTKKRHCLGGSDSSEY